MPPLPWQAAIAAQLHAASAAGRIGHALLLSGPARIGKRRFADALAAALLCQRPVEGPVACGNCRSCTLFAAGTHPDWTLLQPEEGKRDISIDAIRELGEKLTLSAQLRGARVACIDPADALNLNGINALLKTIEEPPSASYLILISARPQALPATLRSRCQMLRFPTPPAAQAQAWLEQCQPDASPVVRAQALHLAHGAPFAAAELLVSGAIERQLGWQLAFEQLHGGRLDPLALAAQIDKDEIRAAIGGWILWLSERLRGALAVRPVVPADRSGGRQGSGPDGGPDGGPAPAQIARALDAAVEALRALDRNANPLLTLEALLIGWAAMRSRAAAASQ